MKFRPLRVATLAVALLCGACATAPESPSTTTTAAGAASYYGAAGARPPATAGTAPSAAQVPGGPRPFADVIKDARETTGLFRLWQKDDKVWMELAPEQFDQPYFFSVNLSRGLGEKFFFAGLMRDSDLVLFRRQGQQVQLTAINAYFFAQPKTPQALGVRESFSDSLISSVPIVSQPHPERKSVLIEVNALLLSDIPAANGQLERTYRQPYSFDVRNSAITKARSTPELTAFNVSAHYALARVVQPPANPGATPATSPPATVPDVRSLFLGFYYNFAKLPDTPMPVRAADDRVGYFASSRFDYTNDDALTPRVNYIQRWRLEKKDPGADLSEPVQPIVFWLDRNIPERYRPTVIEGVLEWNKAFERIGFRNAIEAKVQPDDADWDTLDARHASVRWFTSARPAFGGIGPRQVDPRTGEILDADIGVDPARLRGRRSQRIEQLPLPLPYAPSGHAHDMYACAIADASAVELDFTLDLLEARDELDAQGLQTQAFVLADLKKIVIHEVGHALGLRHNFRGSAAFSQAQLNDVAFTRENGIVGSVMDYPATNIALPGESQGAYFMTTIGPYDYWAIEYGYRPLDPAAEKAELQRIAARNDQPTLGYATDEDAAVGIDPDATMNDLSSDPLEFARRRFELSRELIERWQNRTLKPGESYAVLRRSLTRGLAQVASSSQIAARHVGGVSIVRDHAGSARAPMQPLSADRQRAAVKLLTSQLFSFESFQFRPAFMQRLVPDYLDRGDSFDVGLSPPDLDYSLTSQVLATQRPVLVFLMSDTVAQRILDSQAKLPAGTKGYPLSELYPELRRAIWSELKSGLDIILFRRNLQREHVVRVAGGLLRPAASMPADARALLRVEARVLRADMVAAQRKSGYSAEARAHLAESLTLLDEALKAPLLRLGV
ncbi:MAG: zinc-dependent metalloprotease [Betaproteobacteria bacterium]